MNRSEIYADAPAPGLSRNLAAAYCGSCVRLLDQWCAEGKGPDHFHIGNVVRYWPASLDRFLDSNAPLKQKAERYRKVCPYTFDAHFELVPTHDQLLLPHELADRLGVCKRTLNYWRAWGRGPAFLVDGNRVTYTGTAVRVYLAYDDQQLAP